MKFSAAAAGIFSISIAAVDFFTKSNDT